MNIMKVDIPQALISMSAIFGVALVCYDFNVKVFHTVRDLLRAMLDDKQEEEDEDDEEEDEDQDIN